MLSPRHKYLLQHIRNRRLLVIVWDVLNNNVTKTTIEVAKDLYLSYLQHTPFIKRPDLVYAIAAWNPELVYPRKDISTIEDVTGIKIRVEVGINQPELNTLINDMIYEIIKYKTRKALGILNDLHGHVFKTN